jgi:hypothetical protein
VRNAEFDRPKRAIVEAREERCKIGPEKGKDLGQVLAGRRNAGDAEGFDRPRKRRIGNMERITDPRMHNGIGEEHGEDGVELE